MAVYPDDERVFRARRAKRLAFLAAAIGLAGVVGTTLSSSRKTAPERTEPVAAARPPASPRPARTGTRASAPIPAAPAKPRRALSVRVVGPSGPEDGVFVRAIVNDAEAQTHVECSTPVRTGLDGVARLDVDEDAPSGAWIEVARGDATGLRHGFSRLAGVLVAADAEPGKPVAVTLPAGGSLRVVLEGLPASARPRALVFDVFPPFGDWRALFPDLAMAPAVDGGLVECRAVPRSYRARVGDDGTAFLAHVPADHAVTVQPDDLPPEADLYIVGSTTSTGPSAAAVEGDVLRVPEGTAVRYVQTWRERPAARVRVVSEAGEPVPGARVGHAFRRKGSAPSLYGQAALTDANGIATVVLWSGPKVPDWEPDGFVFVATASGRRAAVVETAGTWYGIEANARLSRAEGSFTLGGTLSLPDGRPAAGIPLRVAAEDPLDARAAFDPLCVTTDGDGAWSVTVPEDLRPVLEYAGGFRVHVDDDRLESMAPDAMWRAMWPGLPRARVEHEPTLPPPLGRLRVAARLSLPP